MTAPTSQPAPADPLHNILKDAEAELHRRLREACDAEASGVSSDSVHEIRHLEDSVFAAAVAAQRTMKLRRQIESRASSKQQVPVQIADGPIRTESTNSYESSAPGEVVRESDEMTDTSVREFTDDAGHTWRAWPVIPRQSQPSGRTHSLLGEFQGGWICFEGVDIAARRRLPYRPPGWASITERELRRLLGESIDATVRIGDNKQLRSE
jgi:hypothetical protein